MDMSKYQALFLVEAREHLATLSRRVIELDSNPTDREGIDAVFREAHSIKGMAASMGYVRTADLAHHLEDLMDPLRDCGQVSPAQVDHLLEGIDRLEGLLADIEAGRDERPIDDMVTDGQPTEQERTALLFEPVSEDLADETDTPLKLEPIDEVVERPAPPINEFDTAPPSCHLLIHLTPEAEAPVARLLLIARELQRLGTLEKSLPSVEQLERGEGDRKLEAWLRTELSPTRLEELLGAFIDVDHVRVNLGDKTMVDKDPMATTVRVRTDLLDHFVRLTGEMITNRTMMQTASRQRDWGQIRNGMNQLQRLVTDLHYHVLQVRMMPLRAITDRLPRLVRDQARKLGKEVRLILEGEGLELDRAILEQLGDPLIHLLRNAIDHGIQHQGVISLRAWREKDLALIEVADDGRGIDPAAVRQQALERGLLTAAQARTIREVDLLQYICHPGFTTTETVSETSGRGVGMDVVKTSVENLGGVLNIQSEPGCGTRFLLKLPLSVAIIRVLLIGCGQQTLAIPITRVLRSLEVERDQLSSSGKQLVIPLEDEIIPLLSLHKILRMPPQPMTSPVSVVVSEIRGRKVGLVVDRLLGQQEVFVQPPPYPLDRLPGISGSTILGDGRVIFLLDVQGLLAEPVGSTGGER